MFLSQPHLAPRGPASVHPSIHHQGASRGSRILHARMHPACPRRGKMTLALRLRHSSRRRHHGRTGWFSPHPAAATALCAKRFSLCESFISTGVRVSLVGCLAKPVRSGCPAIRLPRDRMEPMHATHATKEAVCIRRSLSSLASPSPFRRSLSPLPCAPLATTRLLGKNAFVSWVSIT